MKSVLQLSATFLAVFSFLLLQTAPAHADNEDLDFSLINKTGYGIKAIYIAPTGSTDWGDNIIKAPLENGDELAITFDAKEKAEKWDIRITWIDEGADVVWKGCKLTEISKITLHYDRATDETSATTE